jgi:transposase
MNRKRSKSKIDRTMPMVHPNAAAIDVGATMHMAAVGADRTPEPVRSFGTFTTDLHRLVDWFIECGVETVVMESTSVYWIPIFELLDARGFTLFLVNARDAKHVPGRKTDVSDAQWLQRLHSYGLLRASFRPKGQIAELRAYVRQRERLLEYAASHIQHMQKALTEMNLQLHHVVADITGATGLRIIRGSSPANMTPRCWRNCVITGAAPVRRRSRRRSPVATAPSICLLWSKHSPSTMLTTRRCRPATPGSKPF